MQAPDAPIHCPRCGAVQPNPLATHCAYCQVALRAEFAASPTPAAHGYAPPAGAPNVAAFGAAAAAPGVGAYGAGPHGAPHYYGQAGGYPGQQAGYGHAPPGGYGHAPYGAYGHAQHSPYGHAAPFQAPAIVQRRSAWGDAWNVIWWIRIGIAVVILSVIGFGACFSAIAAP